MKTERFVNQCGKVSVDAGFPGGNVKVDKIDEAGGEVFLRPDNRGGEWFYTNFRVRGAKGRRLRFVYEPGTERLTKAGPAVSSDGGVTWRFLNAEKADALPGEFTYAFGEAEEETFFSIGLPYVEANWRTFVKSIAGTPRVAESVLCKSQNGSRNVELLRISCDAAAKVPFALFFTCRHHACEMSASRVMEGVVEGALADSPEAAWAKANADLFFVPFMDKDGVEEGEQGKARKPHDYNQDYVQGRYSAVRAVRKLVRRESAGRRFFFLDMHAPWIRGAEHDHFYFLLSQNHAHNAFCERFRKILAETQADGALQYDPSWDIPGGAPWNNADDYDRRGLMMASTWAGREPNCVCSMAGEFGYGLAGGVYSEPAARELGRNLFRAVIRSLDGQTANN